MENYNLEIGKVCYWQDGGWHGCHIIVKISERFVYCKTYENKKATGKISRYSKKRFLERHNVFSHTCEYGSYHDNIGEVDLSALAAS